MKSRKAFAILFGLAAAFSLPAQAQSWPTKPVKIVVGFPPGGGTDPLARILAQRLTDMWGQPVIVENRPGASATLGAAAVASAPADGYTLSMGQITPNAIAPALFPKLAYAPKDFAPIVLVGTSSNILVVNPNVAARSVSELVALAKSKPGKLSYASSGLGSLQHIAAAKFASMAGIDIAHIPYKGSGQALTDLLSGQVDINFDSLPGVIQQVKAGKLRALAVTSAKRAPSLPAVPTMEESGLADYDLTVWWGFFAPAGTPADILDKVHRATLTALQHADVKERFAELSVVPGGGTTNEFADLVQREIVKYAKQVKDLGIKVD